MSTYAQRSAAILRLSSMKDDLLRSRNCLDPWSEAWDHLKARYQRIERAIGRLVKKDAVMIRRVS